MKEGIKLADMATAISALSYEGTGQGNEVTRIVMV